MCGIFHSPTRENSRSLVRLTETSTGFTILFETCDREDVGPKKERRLEPVVYVFSAKGAVKYTRAKFIRGAVKERRTPGRRLR